MSTLGSGLNYLIFILSQYLLFSEETVRVSSTLRSQESSDAAKKNPSLKRRLGGDPPKTRYAPHFHHFSFPMLLVQHSWHASSLTFISHISLQITHSRMSLPCTHISSASLERQGPDAGRRFYKAPSPCRVNCNLATQALLSSSTPAIGFIEDLGRSSVPFM